MIGLSTAWTRDIQETKEKDEFEILVRNSTTLLTKLKQILEDRERELTNQGYTLDDFDEPNWSHKQAFRNGALSELKRIKSIIPF